MEKRIKETIDNIISKNELEFIEEFKRLAYNTKKTPDTGFPMFKLGNDDYYTFKEYETIIEGLTREYLIKNVLADFFDLSNDLLEHSLFRFIPFGEKKITKTNAQNEQSNKFEFLIANGNNCTAYRFIDFNSLELSIFEANIFKDYLNEEYDITKITILSFPELKHKINIESYIDNVSYETYEDFFCEFFDKEIYNYYVKEVKRIISYANELAGFKTITNLTTQNLSTFKSTTIKRLIHLVDSLSELEYEYQRKNGSIEKVKLASMSSCDIIKNTLIDKNLVETLVGYSDFAQSFITAEYLYNVLSNNNNFDCTPIICGYVKSVEQFLCTLVKDITPLNEHADNLWITANNIDGIPKADIRKSPRYNKIRVKEEYKDRFKDDLGGLITFLKDSNKSNAPLWNINSDDTNTIIQWLYTYKDMYRNEYFHKSNISINNFEIVDRIKNNTTILLLLLLGSYKIQFGSSTAKKALKISNRFDCLLNELRMLPKSIQKFQFEYSNSYFNALLLPNNDYKKTVQFMLVGDIETINIAELFSNLKKEDVYVLREDTIPLKVYYFCRDKDGSTIKKQLLW